MGQSQNSTLQKLTGDYKIVRRENEQMRIFLIHNNNKRECLFRQYVFNELRQFSLTVEKMRTRKQILSPYLTILQQYEDKVEDTMCSSFYKAYSLWDYPHATLQQDLNERIRNSDPYRYDQLVSIYKSAVEGLRVLQEADIKHQILSTNSILHDKNMLWRVADPLAEWDLSNYELVYSDPSSHPNAYLSPQQCRSIEQEKPIQNKNAYKNDVFTLGIIILQCGLLQNQRQLYSYNYSCINWELLQDRVNHFAKKYPEGDLTFILRTMLAKDILQRPDWIQLKDALANPGFTYSKSSTFKSYASRQSKDENRVLIGGLSTIKRDEKEEQMDNNSRNIQQSQPQYLPAQEVVQEVRTGPPQVMSRSTPNNFASSPVKRVAVNYNKAVSPRGFIPPQEESLMINRSLNQMNTQSLDSPKNQINFQIKPRAYDPHPPSSAFPMARQSIPNRISSPTPRVSLSTQGIQWRNTLNWNSTFGAASNTQQSTSQPYPKAAQQIHTPLPQSRMPEIRHEVRVEPSIVQKKVKGTQQPQLVEEYFKLGSKYEGYKLNGKRHGKGTFHYQDGGRYEGEWREDQMNGKGTLYYQSNVKAYEGEWLNDEFHGQGSLFNENPQPLDSAFNYHNFDEVDDYWVSYEGSFKNDAKEGSGVLVLSNGQQFRGHFKEDMVEGQGQFITISKEVVHGFWKENKLIRTREV